MGNRVWKQYVDSPTTTTRKFIVDIAAQLPVVLSEEIDTLIDTESSSLTKSYIHTNRGQILAQFDNGIYLYTTDRLGSVRQITDWQGNVLANYTYSPFGQMLEEQQADTIPSYTENFENNFKFTGQWYDSEINQYHLRARMYDPQMMRFTTRDPVKGKYNNPLTLHKYLYCLNNSLNRIDPNGKYSFASLLASRMIVGQLQKLHTGAMTKMFRESTGLSMQLSLLYTQGHLNAIMAYETITGGWNKSTRNSMISAGVSGIKRWTPFGNSIIGGLILDIVGDSFKGAYRKEFDGDNPETSYNDWMANLLLDTTRWYGRMF